MCLKLLILHYNHQLVTNYICLYILWSDETQIKISVLIWDSMRKGAGGDGTVNASLFICIRITE